MAAAAVARLAIVAAGLVIAASRARALADGGPPVRLTQWDEAAMRAGHGHQPVIANTEQIGVVASAGLKGPDGGVVAITANGDTVVTLRPPDAQKVVGATIKPFLGRRDLVDIDVELAAPAPVGDFTTAHEHYLVRVPKLELACTFVGASESKDGRAQRHVKTAAVVTAIRAKLLTFEVARHEVITHGYSTDTANDTDRYELPATGMCDQLGGSADASSSSAIP